MSIANCAKCNKVFQIGRSPLCSDCFDATYSNAQHVSDFVWAHPGLTVEEVAKQCALAVKDMEEMLFSGLLGSASAFVMFKCQSCHKKMSAQLRKGRFCPDCASQIEAKVNQMEREAALQKEKEKAQPIKRLLDKKDDQSRSQVEVAGACQDEVASANCPNPAGHAKPAISQEAKHPESPAKQESVSPSSDSYGFKRVSDL
jgi:hypothetical protein